MNRSAVVICDRDLQASAYQHLLEHVGVGLVGRFKTLTDAIDAIDNFEPGLVWIDYRVCSPGITESERFSRATALLECVHRTPAVFVSDDMGACDFPWLSGVIGYSPVILQKPVVDGRQVLAATNRAVNLATDAFLRAKSDRLFSREISQPYVYGKPLRPSLAHLFVGRKDVLAQLRFAVSSLELSGLLLIGWQRIGKTSLLLQLPMALGPGHVVAYVDLQLSSNHLSPTGFFNAIASSVFAKVEESRAGELPAHEESIIPQPFPKKIREEYVSQAFVEWLSRIVKSCIDCDARLVICLDEFEALDVGVKMNWGIEVLSTLRHIQDHFENVVFIFAGQKRPHELGAEWSTCFKVDQVIRIGLLPHDDLVPILIKPVKGFRMKYEAGVVRLLLTLSGGHPYLTQAIAAELVYIVGRDRRLVATREDLSQAADRALSSVELLFRHMWHSIGDRGRVRLRDYNCGRLESDSSELDILKELQLIDEKGSFNILLFKKWLSQEGFLVSAQGSADHVETRTKDRMKNNMSANYDSRSVPQTIRDKYESLILESNLASSQEALVEQIDSLLNDISKWRAKIEKRSFKGLYGYYNPRRK